MIKGRPGPLERPRSRSGDPSGHGAGLASGKGQREGKRSGEEKLTSERVSTRLLQSPRERIAAVGGPHRRYGLGSSILPCSVIGWEQPRQGVALV